MCHRRITSVLAGIFLLMFGASGRTEPQLVTASVAAFPTLTPSAMASVVADPNSDFTVDSATVAINSSENPGASTDPRAMGLFGGGNVSAGTSLDDPVDPAAVFAGGIGIEWGVCLCTGFVSNNEPTRPAGFPALVGIEGANNGVPIDGNANDGEISKEYQASEPFSDDDWAAIHPNLTNNSGDPSVLQFDVVLNSPGFLCVSFAFGSDEFPAWIDQPFNDTIAILVKGQCTPAEEPGENLATLLENGVVKNFSLQDLAACPGFFLKNQMSPSALSQFPGSEHRITDPPDFYSFYDHEFGGFSKVFTRETATALAPGRYTVKFVIQDVSDTIVDSALFIPVDGVKLFALAQGDYNGDGCVDSTDYLVWRANFGRTPATFLQGDGNGDCAVNAADYVIWNVNQGNSGNGHFAADYNRDGCVDQLDRNIWLAHFGITHCASRYEGDANGDGAVDAADHVVWQQQNGSCGGCSEGAMASTGPSLKQLMPENPDVNGDGDVDEADLAAIDAIVTEWKSGNASVTDVAESANDETLEPSPSDSTEPTPTFESFMAELGEPNGTPPPSSPIPDHSLLVPSPPRR